MSKEQTNPRVLVTYQSQTGNTKKVAETIFKALPEPKEIRPLKEAKSLEKYDLIFAGFPVIGNGPNKPAKNFLGQTSGKQVAIFITHAAPMDSPEMPECKKNFKDATSGEIIDLFDCRGQLGGMIKTVMKFAPDPKLREWAKQDDSQGHPDAASLERAAVFASTVLEKLSKAVEAPA